MTSSGTRNEKLLCLVQNWDLTSNDVTSSDRVSQALRELNCEDVISDLSSISKTDWNISYTKSLCLCLHMGAESWLKHGIKLCTSSAEFKRQFSTVMLNVATSSEVQELPNKEHYEYDKSDFGSTAEVSACALQFWVTLCQQSQRLKEDWFIQHIMKTVGVYILMLLTSNYEPGPWTSHNSIQVSGTLKIFLCNFYHCKTLGELLTRSANEKRDDSFTSAKTFLRELLDHLRPKVNSGKWIQNPSHLRSLTTCLFCVTLAEMGNYLEDFLPVSLMLVDNYVTENKMLGLRCLSHVIKYTSRTELQWQNRADVIYDAVKLQLYSREASLLEEALPCMLAVLNVVDGQSDSGEPSKCDDIFRMILSNAEMESLLVLRRTYTSYLVKFMVHMGLGVVKHGKQLIRLIVSYLETYDGPLEIARFNALNILDRYITQAWPRVEAHCDAILKALLRLIYDVSLDKGLTSAEVRQALFHKTKESLILLREVCRTQTDDCLTKLSQSETIPFMAQTASEILRN